MLTFDNRRQWTRLVLRMPCKELSSAHKTVLLALEGYADYRDGTGAHPGEQNLSEAAGVDVRTVRRALAAGRSLGLIQQTAAANPKAGKAAEYSITLPAAGAGSIGLTSPVDNSTAGHTSPVNNPTAGHTSPVETGHHRTEMSFQPDAPVLPPKPYTNTQLRNSGTSPAPRIAETHTDPAPSRFCSHHPQGNRPNCPGCANAQTAYDAWQSRRRERRLGCPWCHGTSTRERFDGEVETCDHETPPVASEARRTLSLVPPLPDTRNDVRAIR